MQSLLLLLILWPILIYNLKTWLLAATECFVPRFDAWWSLSGCRDSKKSNSDHLVALGTTEPMRRNGCNITGHGNDLHSGTSRFNGRGVLILTATGREAGDHGKNQIGGLESSYLVKNTVWCSFQEQVMVLWRKMGSWPRAQGAQLTAAYSEAMRLSVNTSDDRKHAMASCLS